MSLDRRVPGLVEEGEVPGEVLAAYQAESDGSATAAEAGDRDSIAKIRKLISQHRFEAFEEIEQVLKKIGKPVPLDLQRFCEDVNRMQNAAAVQREIASDPRIYKMPVKVPDPEKIREPFEVDHIKLYKAAPGGGTEIHTLVTARFQGYLARNFCPAEEGGDGGGEVLPPMNCLSHTKSFVQILGVVPSREVSYMCTLSVYPNDSIKIRCRDVQIAS